MTKMRSGLLFLCVANSARSQMAEGLARALLPPGSEVYSAGSAPTRLNPLAVQVMAEIGIDITAQRAKAMEEIDSTRIGTVVTLCAEEVCPVFPGQVERLHWPHEDPVTLKGSEEECYAAFRRVRDEIRIHLEEYFQRRKEHLNDELS